MRACGTVLISLVVLGGGVARAVDSQDLPSDRVEEIIQKFAAKEAEFAKARETYTYRQVARILKSNDGEYAQLVQRAESLIENGS